MRTDVCIFGAAWDTLLSMNRWSPRLPDPLPEQPHACQLIPYEGDQIGMPETFLQHQPLFSQIAFDLARVRSLTPQAINGLDGVFYRQQLFLLLLPGSQPYAILRHLGRIGELPDTQDGYWTYRIPHPKERRKP
jgi:hypothetical protein